MLHLYTVEITSEIVVLANDKHEAQELALENTRDAEFNAVASPMRHFPSDWGLQSIPFGQREADDPDRSIGEWIKKGAAPQYG